MKFLKIIFSLICILFLFGCGTVKEGFTNQKKTSSDEFLVEKKPPLAMPPDYDQLPIPKQKGNESDPNNKSIKNLVFDQKKNGKKESLIIDQNQDFENSLLEKIKKN